MPVRVPPSVSNGSSAGQTPSPFFVCFGIGDLIKVKVADAIIGLMREGAVSKNMHILFCGNEPLDDEEFRQRLRKDRDYVLTDKNKDALDEILPRIFYLRMDFKKDIDFDLLKRRLQDLVTPDHESVPFYYATWSQLFPSIARNLQRSGVLEQQFHGRRLPMWHYLEKPVGNDYESAREILASVEGAAGKQNVFLIDHYTGKDTVRNLLVLLFGNSFLFPRLNARYVDRVIISAYEKIGVGDRGAAYENVGALRDMIVPHLMQMLALFSMDIPETVADMPRMKFEALKGFQTAEETEVANLCAFGQYSRGLVDNQKTKAYYEEGVDPLSRTPTFAAIKLYSDSERWKGVPFYLISGKRLHKKETVISIRYRPVAGTLLQEAAFDMKPQRTLIRIQPDPGILEDIYVKAARGTWQSMANAELEFSWRERFREDPRYEYETILLDAMRGSGELFVSPDTILESWRIAMPFIRWQEAQRDLPAYSGGSPGPTKALLKILGDLDD